MWRIASFDIGARNFAVVIEDVPRAQWTAIAAEPGGEPGDWRTVARVGQTVFAGKYDIADTDRFRELGRLGQLLDSLAEWLDETDVFIVEKQMAFGRRTNPRALCLAHGLWMYVAHRYGTWRALHDFPAYHKTQLLSTHSPSAPRRAKMTYGERKKYSVARMRDILALRGQDPVLTAAMVQAGRKLDDLADAVTQLTAFKVLQLREKKKENLKI